MKSPTCRFSALSVSLLLFAALAQGLTASNSLNGSISSPDETIVGKATLTVRMADKERPSKRISGRLHAELDSEGWVWTVFNPATAGDRESDSVRFRTIVNATMAFMMATDPDTKEFVVLEVHRDRETGRIHAEGSHRQSGVDTDLWLEGVDPWTDLNPSGAALLPGRLRESDRWIGNLEVRLNENQTSPTLVQSVDASLIGQTNALLLIGQFHAPDGNRLRNLAYTGYADGNRCLLHYPGHTETHYFWGTITSDVLQLKGFADSSHDSAFLHLNLVRSGTLRNSAWISGWQADIRKIASELPRLHKNLFFKTSHEDWNRRSQQLIGQVAIADESQLRWGLKALVASVGDAHTTINFRQDVQGEKLLPLELGFFEDALYIRSVMGSGLRDRLGWQVRSIEGIPIPVLAGRVKEVVSHENQAWLEARSPDVYRNLDALHYLGVGDGKSLLLELYEPSTGIVETLRIHGRWAEALTVLPGDSPLRAMSHAISFPRMDVPFWHEVSLDGRLLYFQWNACLDFGVNNQWDGKTWQVEHYFKQLETLITNNRFEKIIVDLRYNWGGSYTLETTRSLSYMQQISSGVLHVLIDRETFSSASDYALLFRNHTTATLVGENTGGKPNSYGDIRTLHLNHIHADLNYSTNYFEQDSKNPDSVVPDRMVPRSYRLWSQGRDDAMESILGVGWEKNFRSIESLFNQENPGLDYSDLRLIPSPFSRDSKDSDTCLEADALHRFRNSRTSAYFFTAFVDEAREVMEHLPQWEYEGPCFAVEYSADTGNAPVFRFFNRVSGSHFYTIDPNERDDVIANLVHQYDYEGIAFFARVEPHMNSAEPETTVPLVPVWRCYIPGTASHYFTASPEVVSYIQNHVNPKIMYVEGIAWYTHHVFPETGHSLP